MFSYYLSPAYFSNYFTYIENVHSFGIRQSRGGDLFALHCDTTQYGLWIYQLLRCSALEFSSHLYSLQNFMNILICQILQTHFYCICIRLLELFRFYSPLFAMLDYMFVSVFLLLKLYFPYYKL